MKKQTGTNLLQLIFIFLAVQLNFKGFSQGNSTYVNGTVQLISASPTGGTISNIGGYYINTFTASGTFTVPAGYTATATTLIVAGGGGGGLRHAGGGGAGGLIYNVNDHISATLSIAVGNGGAGSTGQGNGTNGGSSSLGSVNTEGGGGGGDNTYRGQDGGSGGGGSNGSQGGNGNSAQGTKGGDQNYGEGCCHPFGAGGGGYSIAGADTDPEAGSVGGDGQGFNISGTNVRYAGGGGGGNTDSYSKYSGGRGGGGMCGNGTDLPGGDATSNTGGGGGGGGATSNTDGNGGAGGSGIVIIKYISGTGTWTSDNTAIATVDPSSGMVTGVSTGTANIIYTITNSTDKSTYTQSVTVTQQPLAVTLLSFSAVNINCMANLTWKTSSESNNSYYAVEYSTDGIIFNLAAKVPATNHATGSTYGFGFTSILNGITYYRLRIVAVNGSYSFSPIAVIAKNNNCGAAEINLEVSPNPTKDFITVSGLIKGNHLALINAVSVLLNLVEGTGTTLKIDLSKYAKGIYILSDKAADGSIRSVKVVKQ